jgi:hypothetical protein
MSAEPSDGLRRAQGRYVANHRLTHDGRRVHVVEASRRMHRKLAGDLVGRWPPKEQTALGRPPRLGPRTKSDLRSPAQKGDVAAVIDECVWRLSSRPGRPQQFGSRQPTRSADLAPSMARLLPASFGKDGACVAGA